MAIISMRDLVEYNKRCVELVAAVYLIGMVNWRLIGGWRESTGWRVGRLEGGALQGGALAGGGLEVGSWRLEVGGWRFDGEE